MLPWAHFRDNIVGIFEGIYILPTSIYADNIISVFQPILSYQTNFIIENFTLILRDNIVDNQPRPPIAPRKEHF
ncbi:hypothetical protein ASC90_00025 [Rhizobium sp. Root1220]|nr:hypothetical protein ASC90_00025 [Rhizobium sp. Root1220]